MRGEKISSQAPLNMKVPVFDFERRRDEN